MKVSNLVLAAAALALTSGSAFAASNDRQATVKKPLMSVSMEREFGQQRTTLFGLPPSEPTIFGHAVRPSIRDHDLDRTR